MCDHVLPDYPLHLILLNIIHCTCKWLDYMPSLLLQMLESLFSSFLSSHLQLDSLSPSKYKKYFPTSQVHVLKIYHFSSTEVQIIFVKCLTDYFS